MPANFQRAKPGHRSNTLSSFLIKQSFMNQA
jgi:hypothetical protein